MPKVSICIPVYKQPNLLRRLLDSVLAQTYKDYEIIVTDDSPDEAVKEVCGEYIAKKAPLAYFKNAERKGTPENWNEAVSHANGRYIKMMHHDDWFYDEAALGNFVKMLDENPSADLAFGPSWNYAEDNTLIDRWVPDKKDLMAVIAEPKILLRRNLLGTPSVTIYRKDINIVFDTALKWLVDLDFYIAVLERNRSLIYSPDAKTCIGLGTHNVTNQCKGNAQVEMFETLYVYDKYKSRLPDLAGDIKYFASLLNHLSIARIKDIALYSKGLKVPFTAKLGIVYNNLRDSALWRGLSRVKRRLKSFLAGTGEGLK